MQATAETLRHRGPDEFGERLLEDGDGHAAGWFGHTRLKVIDLSENSRQPMSNDDGSDVMTYNGEIYNFRELRDELRGCGHRFRSSGDTEVVLRAYEQWGDDFVRRLDGMFAVAVWNARQGRLVLARDRVGKKPLFYSCFEGGIAFGSEIKALLACPFIRPEIDERQLSRYLVYGYCPWPATLYRGIAQVPPATTVTFDRRGLSPPHPYWSALPAAGSVRLSASTGSRVAELVEQAVVRRMVADVPLGALLSGGIDSSAVVGIMSRHSPEPIHTFSVGFPEEPSFDERSAARGVAAHFNTRHHEFSVHVDALALLDRLLWHHDQPFADSSAIPTFLISQLARDHVTVVLTGDGGDEVFGGYDRFVAARVSRTLPTGAAAIARRAVRAFPRNSGYFSVRRRAERFLELADAPLERRYQSWISVFAPDALAELVFDGGGETEVTESMTRQYAEAANLAPLDQILYANLRTYLPDDLAVKMDRMSMANSLEARSPLLDTQLIEYVGRIPAADKVGVRTLKPVLRASLGGLVPKWVWERRKHGFGVPMGAWMRGPLGDVVEDELLAPSARVGRFIDLEQVHGLYRAHRERHAEHGMKLWTLLTLERWLRSVERPMQLEPPSAPIIRDADVAA
jgi:asparagine synthase (glutamine-hydrolysing)